MIGDIILTIVAFVLFVYILLFKMIKKNDTTYLIILALQAIGIAINLLQVTLGILENTFANVMLYCTCIILPIFVILLEIKQINTSEMLNLAIARIYLWIGNVKKSKERLISIVNKYDNSYKAHKMLAHIYEKEGGMRKAIDEYVKVLDINNKDYKSYYNISILLKELGKKEEAIEMLNNLLKVKPQIYDATVMLGELYLEKEKFKKVIQVYTNSLKFNPEKYETYYNLGIAYSMINDFETARKCFEKTTELNDEFYNAYYRLGQIALLYRDFEAAEQNFLKSIYSEKEVKSYLELAKINIMKNRKEKAILYLNNALKVDTSCYNTIQEEPIFFPIKKIIEKPEKEIKSDYTETDKEQKIEDYLNDTYTLTQTLNKQKNKGNNNK